jgi:hypothetical protein
MTATITFVAATRDDLKAGAGLISTNRMAVDPNDIMLPA